MKNARITSGIVAAVAAVGLALTGCSSDGGDKDLEEVNFGYIADFNGTSLLAIAEDQDLWTKHGLKVELSTFTNGPLQIQALGTGDLDFGYIGPGAMWLPASGEAKIVSVNTLGGADRVIAQPGITSLEDLKGKKVAVPEGTSGDMILNMALETVGLSIDDVEKVAMDPATAVAAMSAGQVDAAGLWFPLISTIQEEVPGLEILASSKDFEDRAFPNAFVGAPKFVDNNEETTVKVLAALREANDFRFENLDQTIELTADLLKLDKDKVAEDASNVEVLSSATLDEYSDDGTVVEWLTGLNGYFVDAGTIETAEDPNTYYTGDLYMKAGK